MSRGLAEPYEGEVKTPSLAQFSATKNKQGANIVTGYYIKRWEEVGSGFEWKSI